MERELLMMSWRPGAHFVQPYARSSRGCACSSAMGRGLDAANLDRSVSPADDFYTYANGSWCKNNPLPGEYSRWVRPPCRVLCVRSRCCAGCWRVPLLAVRVADVHALAQGSFETLAEENMAVLRELLDAAAASPEPRGSVTQKVGDFYKAAMDLAAVEAAGIAPLAELLRLADAAADGSSPLAAALGELHAAGMPSFFGLGDGPDAKDSGRSIAQAHQGGLGLPDRDYYFEACHAEIKVKYEAHVARMLRLLGDSDVDADAAAAAVLALETRLAGAQLTRTERRDPDKTYNKTTLPALASAAPGLDWPLYFTSISKAAPGDINVDCPAALTAAAAAASEATPHALRSYLRWHIVNAGSEYLGDAFSTADFEFYSATLSGQKEQKPRWKRALGKVNAHLGEALGQLYVEKVFPADSKARAAAVVLAVRDALQARLGALPWLADATRQRCAAT